MRRTYITKPLNLLRPPSSVAPTEGLIASPLVEAIGECYVTVFRELFDPRLVEVRRHIENWDLQLELTFEYTREVALDERQYQHPDSEEDGPVSR